MKIWFISDTHNNHSGLEVPEDIEMVIHCGDGTNAMNVNRNYVEMLHFLCWFEQLPVKHKVFIPGNHDVSVEAGWVESDKWSINFLIHESIEIEGIKIFGSPYTPKFHDWAFMKKRNRMHEVWKSVEPCDVLVTHGPPKGVLDRTLDREGGGMISVGCKSLWNRVSELRPKIHSFGHIHDEPNILNFGSYERGDTRFINASCCEQRGALKNHGVVVEI